LFAAVGNGRYSVFDSNGTFKVSISNAVGGTTAGCAFNNDGSKLYTTDFSFAKVVVFDVRDLHSVLQTIDTSPGGSAESIVFDATGDFYVGHADGDLKIRKYSADGGLLAMYSAATGERGTDWMDLAKDQCTLYYTSEGHAVKRFNVCTNEQLSDFVSDLEEAYALRLLPPGDGSGGLLVADTENVKRLDSSGAVIKTYDATGEDLWFSLNLDPDGTSFWSGDLASGNFYQFSIETGAQLTGPIASGGNLGGICLLGEITSAQPVCGNGIKEGTEGCDDGNTIDGDGCSATCKKEPRITGRPQTPGTSAPSSKQTCRRVNQACGKVNQCCSPANKVCEGPEGGRKECKICLTRNAQCRRTSQCCSGLRCRAGECSKARKDMKRCRGMKQRNGSSRRMNSKRSKGYSKSDRGEGRKRRKRCNRAQRVKGMKGSRWRKTSKSSKASKG
jgi:cysteine-rich repeat protein